MTAAEIGRDRWNHNIQYGLELLGLVPTSAADALDVGCGEGWMVRQLRQRVDHVVGLDPDGACLDLARQFGETDGVEYLDGELLSYPFEPSSFDFISCIAVLHHMDEAAGMRRMADLLRPGGTLAIVGLARSSPPIDLPWDLAGAVATRVHKLRKRYWETPAPKSWPPPNSYREIRAISGAALPGRTFRRRALWRYVIIWTRPMTC